MSVKLGQRVTDSVTGFKGIVVERCEFLTGTVRFGVQATCHDGCNPPGVVYFDEERLMLSVKELAAAKSGQYHAEHVTES